MSDDGDLVDLAGERYRRNVRKPPFFPDGPAADMSAPENAEWACALRRKMFDLEMRLMKLEGGTNLGTAPTVSSEANDASR